MDISQLTEKQQEFDKLGREIKASLRELDEDMPSEAAIDGASQMAIKMARWEKLRQELDAINTPTQSRTDSQIAFKYGHEPDNDLITVEICDETAEKIFRFVFDGWCPACCANEINVGEIVCGDCFDKALMFRCQGPPLPREES